MFNPIPKWNKKGKKKWIKKKKKVFGGSCPSQDCQWRELESDPTKNVVSLCHVSDRMKNVASLCHVSDPMKKDQSLSQPASGAHARLTSLFPHSYPPLQTSSSVWGDSKKNGSKPKIHRLFLGPIGIPSRRIGEAFGASDTA